MLKINKLEKTFSFILFFFLLSFNSYSAKYIKGNSHFNSSEGDSLVFIKAQLLSKARISIIDKELKSMGHDNVLFWQTYNEKFDQYFEPILDKLKSKMGMNGDDDSLVNPKIKKKYFKALRYKKLKLKARFGRLDKLIKSFAIEKLSRSTQFPNSRYMKVKAVVNRKKLNKLYFKFIRTGGSRYYRNLFVSIDFKLQNTQWSDFGVEVEKDIKEVVSEHWRRWLEDNLKPIVKDIIISDAAEKIKLEKRFRIPLKEIQIDDSEDREENQSSSFGIVEDKTKNSLWLKMNIVIKTNNVDDLLQIKKCSFDGDFLLIDLSTNELLTNYDFISSSLNIYDKTMKKELSSRVASTIYRLPLGHMGKFKKILSLITKKRTSSISIKSAKSIKEVYSLSKIIEGKGVRLDSDFKMSSFSKENTLATITYRGQAQKMSELLLSFNNMSLSTNRYIRILNKEQPFNIEISSQKGEAL